ncbi:MAG: hypothetical protein RJA63_1264 [Pseudomonadota bacterium]|jgi:hypothetical protein
MNRLQTALLGFALLLPLSASAQGQVYCCSDAAGRRICGDTLPQVCYDRGYREISRGGNIVKEVEAPLTPEQRARREAEAKALKDRLAAEAAAKRRDRVLIDSYPSLADLDKRRDRELSIVEAELRINRTREASLLATHSEIEKKIAAASKSAAKKIPPRLAAEAESNEAEIASVRTILTSKQKEYDALKERFDIDRKRYIELTTTTDSSQKP